MVNMKLTLPCEIPEDLVYLLKKKGCEVFCVGEAHTKYLTFPTLLRCYYLALERGSEA